MQHRSPLASIVTLCLVFAGFALAGCDRVGSPPAETPTTPDFQESATSDALASPVSSEELNATLFAEPTPGRALLTEQLDEAQRRAEDAERENDKLQQQLFEARKQSRERDQRLARLERQVDLTVTAADELKAARRRDEQELESRIDRLEREAKLTATAHQEQRVRDQQQLAEAGEEIKTLRLQFANAQQAYAKQYAINRRQETQVVTSQEQAKTAIRQRNEATQLAADYKKQLEEQRAQYAKDMATIRSLNESLQQKAQQQREVAYTRPSDYNPRREESQIIYVPSQTVVQSRYPSYYQGQRSRQMVTHQTRTVIIDNSSNAQPVRRSRNYSNGTYRQTGTYTSSGFVRYSDRQQCR